MKYLFTILTSVIIIAAVLWPGSDLPKTDLPAIDKLVHFALFASWTIAVIYEFDIKRWWVAVVAGLLFSLFSEVIQIPTEGRSFDLNDLLADAAGVIFGYANSGLVIRVAKKILRRE